MIDYIKNYFSWVILFMFTSSTGKVLSFTQGLVIAFKILNVFKFSWVLVLAPSFMVLFFVLILLLVLRNIGD